MDRKQKQFESLVHAFSSDLYRYAYWLCHDTTVSEDMVQETFMRAWKAIDTLKDINAAKPWLITILRREIARHYGRKRLDTQEFDEQATDLNIDNYNDIDMSDSLSLKKALTTLKQEYMEPLLMQVLGGFSCEEIAEKLDIKPGTVMTRLFRARQQLRKYLETDNRVTQHEQVTK